MIETVKIKSGDSYAIINKEDFRVEQHELFDTNEIKPQANGKTPDTTPGDISTVNGQTAKEVIDLVTDLAKLDELEILERASSKTEGGRKGVLAMIEARRAQLKGPA